MVAVCILWAPFWFNPQTFQVSPLFTLCRTTNGWQGCWSYKGRATEQALSSCQPRCLFNAAPQLERCKDDFEAWMLWMTDVTDTETGSTWWVGRR